MRLYRWQVTVSSLSFLPQQFQNRAHCREAGSELNEVELKAGCEVESLEDRVHWQSNTLKSITVPNF